MKKIVLSFTALVALCGLFLTLTSFSDGSEDTQRYETGLCGVLNPDGSTNLGTRCYTPNSAGPCTRVTECKYQ